jgi:hypothetical protein
MSARKGIVNMNKTRLRRPKQKADFMEDLLELNI